MPILEFFNVKKQRTTMIMFFLKNKKNPDQCDGMINYFLSSFFFFLPKKDVFILILTDCQYSRKKERNDGIQIRKRQIIGEQIKNIRDKAIG
jgi:hypothetical protein